MPNNLKKIRAFAGLTQSELAQLAEVSPQTVYNAESGRRMPKAVIVARFSKVLKCSIEDLGFDFAECR